MKTATILLVLFAQALFAQNVWLQKSNFAGIIRDDGVGFTLNGKGYAGTGRDASFAFTKDFWQYDALTNQWTQVADLPGAERQYAVGFAVNQKGYVVGGTNTITLNDVWQYDDALNTWTQKGDFGGQPRSGAVAFVIGSKAYVGTGRDGSIYMSDFWEYEAAADIWGPVAPLPGPQRWVASAFAIGNKGYVGTGSNPPFNSFLNDFYEFDGLSYSWSSKASLPVLAGRQYAEGFALNSFGYIATGRDSNKLYQNDCWQYNTINNTWQTMASIGAAGRKGVLSFVINNFAYICTGIDSFNTRLNEVWEYTPPTGNNSLSGNKNIEVSVVSKNVYVTSTANKVFSRVEIFSENGTKVFSELVKPNTDVKINCSAYKGGIYIVNVMNKCKLVASTKVLIL